MTKSEFKALQKDINISLDGKKNIQPYRKAKTRIEEAQQTHNALKMQYIKEGKFINRLNAMHDTEYDLESLWHHVDSREGQRSFTGADYNTLALMMLNID
jgi:hypothetical protein